MWADEKMPKPATRVATREGALALVAEVDGVMAELGKVLEVETARVRAGQIREGLAEEERKSALASRYIQGLEALKTNAVALARLAPEALERLKLRHEGFAQTLETNRIVLATARAVSEQLVRTLSAELDAGTRPSGYAPSGYGQAPRAAAGSALVVSKSL